MKLENGISYTTRNGLKTTPMKLSNNGTNYMFEAEIQEKGFDTPTVGTWRRDGVYLTSKIPHQLDII